MENIALWNGNGTATVDGGKLYITGSVNNTYTPLEITFLSGFTKQVGSNGTSRTITVTPTAANNTDYKLLLTLLENTITAPYGPAVQERLVVFTSDSSATVTEIVQGLAAALVPGLPEATASGSANGLTVTKAGSTGAWTSLAITTVNTAEFDFLGSSLSGTLLSINNSTGVFAAPVGKGADLAAIGVPGATAGSLYTVYKSFLSKPKLNGGVTNGIDNVSVTLYCVAGSNVITAIDAFIAGAMTSPAAYNL
jgi:hypothetical protein